MNDKMSTPLVEMRDIKVAFGGVHAVDGVTVDLHAGEVVGLVGGNGAGKSTLMRVLSGAHPADSGEIFIDGKKVKTLRGDDIGDQFKQIVDDYVVNRWGSAAE